MQVFSTAIVLACELIDLSIPVMTCLMAVSVVAGSIVLYPECQGIIVPFGAVS